MYVLTKEPEAWVDIEWSGLEEGSADTPSVQVARSIRMKIAFLPRSQVIDFFEGRLDKSLADLAVEMGRDWAGVVNEKKEPLPYRPELLTTLIDREPGFALGFELSILKAHIGQGRVREGNSSASPAAGRAGGARTNKPRRSKRS